MGGAGWIFPRVYACDILTALRALPERQLTTLLYSQKPKEVAPPELVALADDYIHAAPPPRGTPAWLVERSLTKATGWELGELRALRRAQVDAIAFALPPKGSGIPSLNYVYDFQHVHLPDLFSDAEKARRDREFSAIAKRSAAIIVWSRSVKEDFIRAYPEAAARVHLLSPVTALSDELFAASADAVRQHYHLPERFVYLPNQFWKHKNHQVVFSALKILMDRGIRPFLVCSGFPGDNRHTNYFSEVLHQISVLGIRDQIAFLGLVQRDHVLQLMRQSIGVINPSRFEGFGMSVEEARSVGKSLLLSDIDPFREQNPPHTKFFPKENPEALAGLLASLWAEEPTGPQLEREAAARTDNQRRRLEYGKNFQSLVLDVARSTAPA